MMGFVLFFKWEGENEKTGKDCAMKKFYEILLPNPSSPNADSDSLFTKFYKESV